MSETLTIIISIAGINLAILGILVTVIIWSVNKLDSDIKGISTRMDGHAMRIDQLYRMFVDLVSKK